jgi:hypothetical protein
VLGHTPRRRRPAGLEQPFKTINSGGLSEKTQSRKRVVIIHEMTIEEARNTEVSITKTERGRYENAHIKYRRTSGCNLASDTNGRTKS